ncbi:MAG: glycosyltransferase family 61 protein [Bacteroidota bacterium]|nr:glycosyltransferase family 61 protein [Bacteroidota bacterium]
MNKIVEVPYPLNIANQNTFMYAPYLSYEIAPQRIRKIKNVFVTFSGFCMNSNGLIRECHHNYPQQHNDYLNEAAQYYYDTTDRPKNLLTLDDDRIYLTVHHPWFNYYHWMCESIFRLWIVRRQLDRLTLVLPEYYKDADFITGSLEPFKIKHVFYIPQGKSLMVKNLCLPQIKPICDSYNSKHLKQVARFYRDYVLLEKKIKTVKTEKLYVSRHFASRRKVLNENEIVNILEKYGFTIFHPEKHSFLEQVGIFSHVKYLVGEHGSGLTNLMFMQRGASLLEMHKNKTNELDHPSPLFWYMAHALEINYYHQLCDTPGRADYFDGDYLVDTGMFEKNLVKMLNATSG